PSTSAGPPPAASSPDRIRGALLEPTRQGTHLPHDSSRKNRSTFVAAANRSVPSAITTSPPEPSIDPASPSAARSSGTSSWTGPRKFDDAPPGWNAATFLPPDTPPASSSNCRTVVPIGTQYTPGCSTCPETAKNFRPELGPVPCAFHQDAPRLAMTGTCANV